MTLNNQIRKTRTEEILGERGPEDRRAVLRGELDEFINRALIIAKKEAIVQARKAAAAARGIYGSTSFAVSDVLIPSARVQANPLTILSETVSGFQDSGFLASFEGYFDNTHASRSFGDVVLIVNGATVARVRMGARISDPAEGIGAMLPFSLSGIFNMIGEPAPAVQVQAYAFDVDSPTTAPAGFYIRSGRLVISGAQ